MAGCMFFFSFLLFFQFFSLTSHHITSRHDNTHHPRTTNNTILILATNPLCHTHTHTHTARYQWHSINCDGASCQRRSDSACIHSTQLEKQNKFSLWLCCELGNISIFFHQQRHIFWDNTMAKRGLNSLNWTITAQWWRLNYRHFCRKAL